MESKEMSEGPKDQALSNRSLLPLHFITQQPGHVSVLHILLFTPAVSVELCEVAIMWSVITHTLR